MPQIVSSVFGLGCLSQRKFIFWIFVLVAQQSIPSPSIEIENGVSQKTVILYSLWRLLFNRDMIRSITSCSVGGTRRILPSE